VVQSYRGGKCTKCYLISKIKIRLSIVLKILDDVLRCSTIDGVQGRGRPDRYIDSQVGVEQVQATLEICLVHVRSTYLNARGVPTPGVNSTMPNEDLPMLEESPICFGTLLSKRSDWKTVETSQTIRSNI